MPTSVQRFACPLPIAVLALLLLAASPPGGDQGRRSDAPVPGTGAPWQLPSPEPGDRFGAALGDAGDLDGDGVHEVLVGAWRSGGLRGRAELRAGADGRLLASWRGVHPGDALGWALVGLGDVDGDGLGDLALAAPAGEPPAGRVRLVSGADGRLLRELVGGEAGERFGHALAALGDVDGDGLGDLAIGAPQASGAGPAAGRVLVVSGGSGALLWVRQGAAAFDQLGRALASPGDVDGDGLADLAVAAPLGDDGAFNGGQVLLLGGRDGALLQTLVGDGVGDQLGTWLAGPGDLDGDGGPELAVAAPGADGAVLDGGVVQVLGVEDGAPLWSVAGSVAGEGLGIPAAAGDLDGDGLPDLAVGSPQAGGTAWGQGVIQGGQVRLHQGSTGLLLGEDWGRRAWGWAGLALVRAGDQGPLLLGAPGHDDVIDLHGMARTVVAQPPTRLTVQPRPWSSATTTSR